MNGSPPRVWGIRKVLERSGAGRRFTPTRVGNTNSDFFAICASPVHPHACGEYFKLWIGDRRARGSPPRVWGIRKQEKRAFLISRFTPTRVGNTRQSFPLARHSTVHPHACGEYRRDLIAFGQALGSPPRVWGIRRRSVPQRRETRFTPTRVGNTRTGANTRKRSPVHPHACGEYIRRQQEIYFVDGSPPRVWGIL